jgi:hypothetical protein
MNQIAVDFNAVRPALGEDGNGNLLGSPLAGWSPRRQADHVTDGLSNTAMLVERHIPPSHRGFCCWAGHVPEVANFDPTGAPFDGPQHAAGTPGHAGYWGGFGTPVPFHDLVGIARRPNDGAQRPGSDHVEVINTLMGDGAVRALSKAIDGKLLYSLGHISDGRVLEDF